MGKKGKGVIIGIIGLAALSSIFSSDNKIESIELSVPNYQNEYDINTNIPVDVTILPEDAETSSLEYITDGNSIVFSSSGITTGIEEGSYEIYIASGDIKSDTITINVVDITSREEAKKVEEKTAKEAEEKAAKEAEEKAAKEAEEKATKEAEEKAAKEAEEKATKEAEEKAAKEAEEKAAKEAEEKAAKEAEEKAAKEAEEKTVKEAEDKVVIASDNQVPETNVAVQETPSQNAAASSGGDSNFNTYDNVSQQQTEATYVLNTSSKKIHHPTCNSVKKIAPQNYATSNSSVDELISQGYSTCGNCFK